MTNPILSVPDPVTFEEAIALTQTLLDHMERQELPDAEIERVVAALITTEGGGRGFFLTYLTDERSLANQPSSAVTNALQSSPDIVSKLLVKNLAMSAAMAITHRRNQNEEMAEGSDRVRSRAMHLIELVQLPGVVQEAQLLHESAATGIGEYQKFLERWGYDAEQRQAIQQVLEEAIALHIQS
jgi:hypothetical protein